MATAGAANWPTDAPALGTLGAVARTRGGKKNERRGGGRRRNYAPAPDTVGARKYLPVGWVNWLGLVIFALIFFALLAETIRATVDGRGADPIAAAVMTLAFGYMVYLFGTTRLRDQ